MQTLRRMTIWFLGFLCVTALSMLIYLVTLQTTVLNRTEVKHWIADGGVYKNNLVTELIQTGAAHTEAPDPATTVNFTIPSAALKLALEQTFTPEYVQAETEGGVDKLYDWLNGKTPSFAYTIPINEKRDTFIAKLAAAVTPTVAQLPLCSSALPAGTACRPQNIAPDVYATEIITQNTNTSHFFDKPIVLGDSSSNTAASKLPLIVPGVVKWLMPLYIIFSVMLALSVALIIWMAPTGQRFSTFGRLNRRIFFGQTFTLVIALFTAWAFYSNYFSLASIIPVVSPNISATVGNVLKIALVATSVKLVIFSGLVCIVSLAFWLSIKLYQRKKQSQTADPAAETPQHAAAEQPPSPAPPAA